MLVVGAIASVQFGAAVANTLFSRVGPGGAVTLRLVSASVVLVALWRPGVRGRTSRELALALVFGIVLAGMNLCFYEALDRIPLGIAVTFEFVGPLTVAVLGSRRRIGSAVGRCWRRSGSSRSRTAGPRHLSALGVVLALVAGGFWGGYILINARVGRAFSGGTGLALAMVVAVGRSAAVRHRPGRVQTAGAPLAAGGLCGRDAVLGDPLLARARGAAADRHTGVRRAHEPRAGDGRPGRADRPRAGAGSARASSGSGS